jgi:Cu(I)/Ag(I) efflux system membrane fusion protein
MNSRAGMLRTIVLIAAGAAIGIAAGAYWHGPLMGLLGKHASGASQGAAATGLWTCGMHPQVIQNSPGDCPICHMKLTPARGNDGAAAVEGQISINPIVVQNMGVKTGQVIDGPLVRTVRAFGTLEEAETSIRDINLRVSGWVRKVYVASPGVNVEPGEPLFDLYSPDLQVAADELIAARRMRDAVPNGPGSSLFDAARKRLRLLGLDEAQVDALSKLDKAPDSITFTSPIAGSVIEKPIVEGAAVSSGERAMRIVDHSKLWIDAQVFEKDLPFIRLGSKASASIESRPRNTYEGEIVFIHPHVDPMTRSAMARMEILNPGLALKPGMYAAVSIEAHLAERAVLVPRDAVIDTGETQTAMVALGNGKFEARAVRLGLSGDEGMAQVVSGLSAGETIVTSGQFLLDSESRAQTAIRKFMEPETPGATPGRRMDATPAQRSRVDATVKAYLALWDALGADEAAATPVNPAGLIEAARTLLAECNNSPIERLARDVHRTSEAMAGKGIADQRAAFKPVSMAVIALIDAAPPTTAVGKVLYIMSCPMTPPPGAWVQDSDDLVNPYETDMRSCGETLRKIQTDPGAAPPGAAGAQP